MHDGGETSAGVVAEASVSGAIAFLFPDDGNYPAGGVKEMWHGI